MADKIEPNSIEDFMKRFEALQDEAETYGVISIVICHSNDVLNREETKVMNANGNYTLGRGLIAWANDSYIAGHLKED